MRRRRLVPATSLAALLAAVLSRGTHGQTSRGLVEVGAARLQHGDIAPAHAATVGATIRRDEQRFALAATGALTLADEGRSTSQGLFTASILARPRRPTRWEIGGALTAFGQGSVGVSPGAYLLAREHFANGGFGGWAGVALGGVEDGDRWSPTRTAEIASWFARRGMRVSAAAVVVDTRSEEYTDGGGNLVTDPITYTDVSLGLRLASRRVELDTRGGLRLISRGALTATGRGTRPFAAVDAAVWLTPRVALVAGFGRQLSDLPRGTPDTRFAALALRYAMRDRAAPARPRRPAAAAALSLALSTDSVGQPRLVVTAPSAGVVELAATFTGWEPVRLVRRGDVWELGRFIPSGAHRVLVRVDGGSWMVPPNLPATADDFGGTVGIITIP